MFFRIWPVANNSCLTSVILSFDRERRSTPRNTLIIIKEDSYSNHPRGDGIDCVPHKIGFCLTIFISNLLPPQCFTVRISDCKDDLTPGGAFHTAVLYTVRFAKRQTDQAELSV